MATAQASAADAEPNTTMRPSPRFLTSVPPASTIVWRRIEKCPRRSSSAASGDTRCDKSVEPTTSVNRMTVLSMAMRHLWLGRHQSISTIRECGLEDTSQPGPSARRGDLAALFITKYRRRAHATCEPPGPRGGDVGDGERHRNDQQHGEQWYLDVYRNTH